MAAPGSPWPRGAEEDLRAPVVAVDCNGADRGPAEVAAGALIAAGEGARVMLFGPASELNEAAQGVPGIEVVDASISIAKAADPASAARRTPQASIVQAARAVAEDRAQALVCAGGTGAALAAGYAPKGARRLLRTYAALEIVVAVSGVLIAAFLPQLSPVLSPVYKQLGNHPIRVRDEVR